MIEYTEMFKKIERIVEDACRRDSNIFGYGIWTHHIKRVVENVNLLAPVFNADLEIVELAALLHDYASIKDGSLYKEHHIHSQYKAEKILREFNYPDDKIEKVKYCILTHRGSVSMERESAEAECLANADAMTHIQEVPSLLYAAFMKKDKSIDEGTIWVREKLQRSWNKLTPDVQNTIREKYHAAMILLESFK